MKNLEACIYTWKHRRAFEYCVRRLIREPSLRGRMLSRAASHDMDKMIMYLLMDPETAQEIHVRTSPHHMENALEKSRDDLVETVIDYECAPYTKPDKPLFAWDFVNRLLKEKRMGEKDAALLREIMEELGIAHPESLEDDPAGTEFIRGLGPVSEEMIFEEIFRYLAEHPQNELKRILAETGRIRTFSENPR